MEMLMHSRDYNVGECRFCTKVELKFSPETTIRTASIEEKNEEEAVDGATARKPWLTKLDDMSIGPILCWREELMDHRPEREEVVHQTFDRNKRIFLTIFTGSPWRRLSCKWETPDGTSH